METEFQLEDLRKYAEIETELRRAEQKHPIYPEDIFVQVAIMNEEAGEVTKAILEYKYENGDIEEVKKELIQTAAMCMRMLHHL